MAIHARSIQLRCPLTTDKFRWPLNNELQQNHAVAEDISLGNDGHFMAHPLRSPIPAGALNLRGDSLGLFTVHDS